MRAFWFAWGIDAIIAAVFVWFFFIGLADGSVSSFNIGLWSVILLGLGVVLGGSIALRSAGYGQMAMALLWLLAAPGLMMGLFFAVLFFTHPRWN